MVDAALDAGITSLDTANGYAATRTEEILGEVLAGRRDQVDAGHEGRHLPRRRRRRAPAVPQGDPRPRSRPACAGSGTDHVDLFYLHQPDRSVTVDETAEALAECRRPGSVQGRRRLQLRRLADRRPDGRLRARRERRARSSRSSSTTSSPAGSRTSTPSSPRPTGWRTIVYNPLGGGLLTGRHSFDDVPGDGRFGSSALSSMYRDRYWNRSLFEAVDALSTIASEAGIGLPELSLRWLLSRPSCPSVLLGRFQARPAAGQHRCRRARPPARRRRRRVRRGRRHPGRSDAGLQPIGAR